MTRGERFGRSGAALLAWACLAAPQLATGAGPFDGAFVNAEGERLQLRQAGAAVEGTVTVTGQAARIAGRVSGGVLSARLDVPGAGAVGFTARATGDGLRVQLEGDDEVSLFRRQKGAQPPAAEARPRPPAGGREAPVGPAPQPVGATPGGHVYRAEYEGWSVAIPAGWKHAPRGGGLALGSDREAGLILVVPTTTTDAAALDEGLGELLAELGRFPAAPALQAMSLPGGQGRWTEVQGVAQDGTAVRVRAVGVVGAAGTVGVLGITTPDAAKLSALRQRVDAMARSVRFFKPTVSPARQLVVGEWWSYTSASGVGGTGGTEKTLAFCPDGTFFSSSESSYGGGAGTSSAWGVAGARRGVARWNAVGDRSGGRITLTYPDGRSAQVVFQPGGGDAMRFDGRVYGRTGEHRYCR